MEPETTPTAQPGERFPVEKLEPVPSGKAVVYFYPKDSTPGCTLEAKRFNDLYDRFQEAGYDVIGVSVDTEQSHASFAEECGLRFPLVSDEDHSLSKQLGVLKDRGHGPASTRTTFLLGDDGTIERIWNVTDAGSHPDEVLAAIDA
jgi:thioredoxin-dependent peroxiredoxin